jgi:hypothetical protein
MKSQIFIRFDSFSYYGESLYYDFMGCDTLLSKHVASFRLENEDTMFSRNVGISFKDYTVSQLRRPQSEAEYVFSILKRRGLQQYLLKFNGLDNSRLSKLASQNKPK